MHRPRDQRGVYRHSKPSCVREGTQGALRPYLDLPKDRENARLRNCSVRF